MKSNNYIILSVIVGVLGIGLVIFLTLQQNKTYSWLPRFKHDKSQPYDFAYLQAILKESYNFTRYDDYLIEKELLQEDLPASITYFFIGSYPHYTTSTADSLIQFAEKGGTVFLACDNLPDSLLNRLISEDDCQDVLLGNQKLGTIGAKNIKTYFTHPSLKENSYIFTFRESIRDSSTYFWPYIHDHYNICDTTKYKFNCLGYFYTASEELSYTNFIRIKVGKGYIYWHTNPILFSNLYLAQSNFSGEGLAYLDKILLHLNTNRLIWDHASVSSQNNNFTLPQRYNKQPSPMEYIFSQPALTWAWLGLLSMTVLYGLFGAKRRQRAIPIVEGNKNTSLEFVQTIGQLYYQQQNHKIIFEKLMQLYLAHLRKRYGVVVRAMDKATIDYIVTRSAIKFEIVNTIFQKYIELSQKLNVTKHSEMTANTLNEFYTCLERFYLAEEERDHK